MSIDIFLGQGGLGNLLFQLAAALEKRDLFKSRVVFIMTSYKEGHRDRKSIQFVESLSFPGVTIISSRILHRLIENFFSFTFLLNKITKNNAIGRIFEENQDLLLGKKNRRFRFFRGYFQDHRLVEQHSKEIIDAIQKQLHDPTIVKVFSDLGNEEYNSFVGIHFRRGDFQEASEVHGLVSLESLSDILSSSSIKIVSSDSRELLEQIKRESRNCLILDPFINDTLQTFGILVKAREFYSSNSTFSWWIAYFIHKQGGKVFLPYPWNKTGGNIFPKLYFEGCNVYNPRFD